MTKYLSKGIGFNSYMKKSYLSAKGLNKPIHLYNPLMIKQVENKLDEGKIICKKEFNDKHYGKIEYSMIKMPSNITLDLDKYNAIIRK